MRLYFVILALLFSIANGSCQSKMVKKHSKCKTKKTVKPMVIHKENQDTVPVFVLEYTANTRGFYQKVVVENQTVSVSKDREDKKGTTTKITDADWKQIVAEFKKLNLDKLAEYKDPTQKRFYDGAAIANLKVLVKEKTYESKNFDHGFPPAEIKILIDKINAFVKKTE